MAVCLVAANLRMTITAVGPLLDEIAAKNPAEFFLNPGSESAELVAAAEARGLHPIRACSIVSIGLRPEMFADQ